MILPFVALVAALSTYNANVVLVGSICRVYGNASPRCYFHGLAPQPRHLGFLSQCSPRGLQNSHQANKRNVNAIYSQKHILDKERYIRRPKPEGFGIKKKKTPEPKSNRTKEIVDDFAKQYPSASIKELWEHYEFTGPIKKGIVTGRLLPGKNIKRPNYYASGLPKYVDYPRDVDYRGEHDPRGTIKTDSEIAGIRYACRIAREVLDSVSPLIVEGMFTDYIDRHIHRMCRLKKVYPSPLNYHGFPKSVCTSINEIVCHGIPDSTVLAAGDIINVDVTVYADGFHGDVSETFMVLPAEDPKKLASMNHDIGMYERNKLRYNAKFHDNLWDSGATVMTELNILQCMDTAVRRLGPQDGWEEWFDMLYTGDPGRRPIFGTKNNDDLDPVAKRIMPDIEAWYTANEAVTYKGRVVGVVESQIPTYIAPPGQPKRYATLENPEVIHHIFNRVDPDRRKKPYLFTHTFKEDIELMQITHDAMMKAIAICAPGVPISRIGDVISDHVEQYGFRVVPNLVGHGIGRNFHENPIIEHTRNQSEVVMEPGMVFTIEPIVTRSMDCEVITWPDGWTMATSDARKTAQFEHTVLITDHGHEILTQRLPSSPPLIWNTDLQVMY
ncbi:Metallopeptidase M24 family protein [Babesia bovis T2Bo]|uniref:Methionine aminopeptidase I, putative n=1 Tax=Babesia bovis TaxID=5865 RepID=A7AVG6_BABBO|nr:Metallopeptidase M24 family protein [Babesia bovis T2Bo]EDO05792.1 Metallopeptidase M24 family protein [Babesia bovis T2Bo]|eukprot:XP_001609360.1 methionine aminopeptidase I [Babesia bovis T2Bo]